MVQTECKKNLNRDDYTATIHTTKSDLEISVLTLKCETEIKPHTC